MSPSAAPIAVRHGKQTAAPAGVIATAIQAIEAILVIVLPPARVSLPLAPIAAKRQLYPSSPDRAGRSIAAIATAKSETPGNL